MAIELTVTHLSGSRKNTVESVRGAPIWFGRAEKCHVRFDPEVDRKVSAIHAELREGDDGTVSIHDLGSRNGVLLNGAKIEASAEVTNRSTIQLGTGGPRLRLEFEAAAGGISFGRVRSDTKRKLDKNKVLSLLSTDESIPAYTPEQLGEVEPKTKEAPKALILGLLGIVLALILLFLAFK